MYLDINNIPFYIGKGKDYRHKVQEHLGKYRSNTFLKNKIRKVGIANVKIHFLHKDISEKEAFSWERYWIKYIGRRDLKEGSLCNLTDGGEGNAGAIRSKESRQKLSELNKGKKNAMYGRSHTKEARLKMRDANKGRKLSSEVKQKMSIAKKGEKNHMYGKKLSNKAKQRMSIAKKGKPAWNKGRKMTDVQKEKISKSIKGRYVGEKNPMYGRTGEKSPRWGKHHSKETRYKMSESTKRNWAKRKKEDCDN